MDNCTFQRSNLVSWVLFSICMMHIIKLDPDYQKFIFGTSITREQLFLSIMLIILIYQAIVVYRCKKQQ